MYVEKYNWSENEGKVQRHAGLELRDIYKTVPQNILVGRGNKCKHKVNYSKEK